MSLSDIELSGDYRQDCQVLQRYLASLRDLAASAEDKTEFDRRAAALEKAREHVSGLPAQQPNERGYRDNVLSGSSLVNEELRIARFLLEERTG